MYCSCCSVVFTLSVVVLHLTITQHTVGACKVANWHSESFLQRAARADIIAYGKVIDLTPIEGHPRAWPDAYDAQFEFYCVLRESPTMGCADVGPDQFGICIDECGENADSANCTGNEICCPNGCGHVCVQPVNKRVIHRIATVRDMGKLTSCSRTIVEKGNDYVILLKWRDDDLFPHEINTQSAAFPDTWEIWDDLSVLCDVDTIAPKGTGVCPSNVTLSKSLSYSTDAPCYSGISSGNAILTTSFLALMSLFLGPVILQDICWY